MSSVCFGLSLVSVPLPTKTWHKRFSVFCSSFLLLFVVFLFCFIGFSFVFWFFLFCCGLRQKSQKEKKKSYGYYCQLWVV